MGHEHPSAAVPRQVQRIQRFRFAIICLQQIQVGVPLVPNDLHVPSTGQLTEVPSWTTFVSSSANPAFLATFVHMSCTSRRSVRISLSFRMFGGRVPSVSSDPCGISLVLFFFVSSFHVSRFLPSTHLASHLSAREASHRDDHGACLLPPRAPSTSRANGPPHLLPLTPHPPRHTPSSLPLHEGVFPIGNRTDTPFRAATPGLGHRPSRGEELLRWTDERGGERRVSSLMRKKNNPTDEKRELGTTRTQVKSSWISRWNEQQPRNRNTCSNQLAALQSKAGTAVSLKTHEDQTQGATGSWVPTTSTCMSQAKPYHA